MSASEMMASTNGISLRIAVMECSLCRGIVSAVEEEGPKTYQCLCDDMMLDMFGSKASNPRLKEIYLICG